MKEIAFLSQKIKEKHFIKIFCMLEKTFSFFFYWTHCEHVYSDVSRMSWKWKCVVQLEICKCKAILLLCKYFIFFMLTVFSLLYCACITHHIIFFFLFLFFITLQWKLYLLMQKRKKNSGKSKAFTCFLYIYLKAKLIC